MGILDNFPPELLTFFTWSIYLVGGSAIVLAVCIFVSKFMDQFIDFVRGLR